mmetsp:Transcript_99306/g.318612  ORF Transcript_99306/g.318612 Transcript_99306/m.318612 type:complete len:141 (+) Transcript_99306:32-454(+)
MERRQNKNKSADAAAARRKSCRQCHGLQIVRRRQGGERLERQPHSAAGRRYVVMERRGAEALTAEAPARSLKSMSSSAQFKTTTAVCPSGLSADVASNPPSPVHVPYGPGPWDGLYFFGADTFVVTCLDPGTKNFEKCPM